MFAAPFSDIPQASTIERQVEDTPVATVPFLFSALGVSHGTSLCLGEGEEQRWWGRGPGRMCPAVLRLLMRAGEVKEIATVTVAVTLNINVVVLCRLHKGLKGFLNSILSIPEFCKMEILEMDDFFGLHHIEQYPRRSHATG